MTDTKNKRNLKHGAYAVQVRQRYSDARTTEGKQLAAVMDGLVSDLGGAGSLSAAQRLLLDNIRAKLIVLFQIGKFVDAQDRVVDTKGELLPCLSKSYLAFCESVRRDLEAIAGLGQKAGKPDLTKYISQAYGDKK